MEQKKDDSLKSKEMSRRKFLAMSAASSVAAGLAVPIIGNAYPDDGLRRNCWDTIRDDKTNPHDIPTIEVPPEVDEAFPKLKIHDLSNQIPTLQLGTPALGMCAPRLILVENIGMTVASNVYVEMLEANRMAPSFEEMANNPVSLESECFRRDIYGPVVLYPDCSFTKLLVFKREFPQGQSICICYDSIKDPRKFPNGVGIGVPENRKLSYSGAFSHDDPHNFHYFDINEGTGGEPC